MQYRVARMQDIAKEVGVSPATVSLVLNNKAAALRISSAVQSAVWAAAQRAGYRPNLSARRLRSTASPLLTIALVTAREAPLAILNSVNAGAHAYADVSPVPVQITVESFAMGRLGSLPGLNDGLRFHGAIIANTGPEDDAYLVGRSLPVPVVLFSRHLDGCNYISASNDVSGRQAAELLLGRGCRHLCVLTCARTTQARSERTGGFCDVVTSSGLPMPVTIVSSEFNERGGHEAMAAFLATGQPCDGLFAIYDYMAFGAMHALRRSGRRIPDDVAVVGHDDLDMASYVDPPLTTFHMPLAEMAKDAAETLVRILIGELTEPVQRAYPISLVQRESA
jgi:DNA-binding LacI/PurR family transcriptional regulator